MKKQYEGIKITWITLTETEDILLSPNSPDTDIDGAVLYTDAQASVYRPNDSRYRDQ